MAAQKTATRERAASQKTPARTTTTARRGTSTRPARTEDEEHGPAVPVPVVMPRVKVMRVPLPTRGISYVGDAGRIAASFLPPPDRLAFYGGLAAAAALGVIDWPVAAAIGLATLVARRSFRGRRPGPAAEAGGAGAPRATAEARPARRAASTARTRTAGKTTSASRSGSAAEPGSTSRSAATEEPRSAGGPGTAMSV